MAAGIIGGPVYQKTVFDNIFSFCYDEVFIETITIMDESASNLNQKAPIWNFNNGLSMK